MPAARVVRALVEHPEYSLGLMLSTPSSRRRQELKGICLEFPDGEVVLRTKAPCVSAG